MNRKIAFNLAVIMFLSTRAIHSIAQDARWSIVRNLNAGQNIRIQLANGQSQRGTLSSVTDAAVVLNSGEGVPRENVQHVWVQSEGRRGRHALIGAAIGAGAGLGVGAAIDHASRNYTENLGKAILTPGLGAVGAAIGAVLPSHHWHQIY